MRQVWDNEEVVTQMSVVPSYVHSADDLGGGYGCRPGTERKQLCLATCGRLWCLCLNDLNSFRLMAKFSAQRACTALDTDVPWTSITVMIHRGPVFDSGSGSEQRRGFWSLLLVLGSGTGFDTASSGWVSVI